jgi:hypothetical protein
LSIFLNRFDARKQGAAAKKTTFETFCPGSEPRMPEPRIPDVDDDIRKSGIPDVDDDTPLFPAKGKRKKFRKTIQKNSENYLMDMLQVVVHIQIKKQHNVLPTNPCIRIIFKHIQLIIV